MNATRILIVGGHGQLGRALQLQYPEATALGSDQFDITNPAAYTSIDWKNFDVVINAAAMTAVDKAEEPEGRILAWKQNADAVRHLVRTANQHALTLVHVSSDYVFDGSKSPHTEDEALSPLGVYGQSKAAGDLVASLATKHYIVRTSWVIGDGNNFVRIMQSLADKGIKPTVVSDQVGRLTFTSTLSRGIKHLLDTDSPHGVYNITNDGSAASWSGIAKLVFEKQGKSADDVTPVTTEAYYAGKPYIAPRPRASELSLEKIKSTGFILENWRDLLDTYINDSEGDNR